MKIEFEIEDSLFPQDDLNRIAKVFEVTNEEVPIALSRVAAAAFFEITRMLLGENLPTRADEMRQHRLLHMINFVFDGRFPTESQISSMFQLTGSQSRTLLRNVRSRFKHQLEDAEHQTLTECVQQAQQESDDNPAAPYRVVIHSDNTVEALNQILEKDAPTLDPVKKVRGSSRNYEISADAMQVLRDSLGLA